MAHTPATFKAAWPEFALTPDALVETKLADATRSTSAAVFGDRFDEAVGLLCAHKLALSASGQGARLESDAARTTYLDERERVARACGGGFWTIGVDP